MVKSALALVLTAALAAGAAPRAQAAAPSVDAAMPPFPSDSGDAAAMVWLRKNTDLGVGRHVVFGRDNVLVVLDDEVSTRAPSVHRVSYRQEAVKIEFV